jgi:hypothetical protein
MQRIKFLVMNISSIPLARPLGHRKSQIKGFFFFNICWAEIDLPDQKHIGNSWFAFHHHKPSRAPSSVPATIIASNLISVIQDQLSYLLGSVDRIDSTAHIYLSNKVTDNTAIVNAHARAICVEDTCDPNLKTETNHQNEHT